MRIRIATAADEEWIRSLIPRLHHFGPPDYRPVAAMDDAEATATIAALASDDPRRTVLVAESADAVRAGFVHLETGTDFFTHEQHGHISVIVVAAEAEGTGVGRALLDAAETWTRERGYQFLTLNVFEKNAAARRLYERAGFGIDTVRYLKLIRESE